MRSRPSCPRGRRAAPAELLLQPPAQLHDRAGLGAWSGTSLTPPHWGILSLPALTARRGVPLVRHFARGEGEVVGRRPHISPGVGCLPFSSCVALLVAVVGLGSAAPAGAGNRHDDRLARAVATVAGRSVAVSCETDTAAWKREVSTARLAAQAVAYYDPNLDRVRFGPVICADSTEAPRGANLRSVRALFVAAHEGAHAAGVEDEGTANCWALHWAQELSRRYAGVGYFTSASRRVRLYARQLHRDSPRAYHTACAARPSALQQGTAQDSMT